MKKHKNDSVAIGLVFGFLLGFLIDNLPFGLLYGLALVSMVNFKNRCEK